MVINEKIYEKLDRFSIENKNAAVIYLLSVYYKIDAKGVIDDEFITQVNLSKIVERDYLTGTIKWNTPLFTDDKIEVPDKWAWVLEEYRKLWMDIRGSKGGDRATCIDKMKKFFAANPSVRKQDVMGAAKYYTSGFINANNPTYMVEADNFIYKKADGVNRSRLEVVLEELKAAGNKTSIESNRYDGKIK